MLDNNNAFEAIIIGGSYAGLSAALTLGRSLRKTLVIDAGSPCNAQTPHSQNFLTQDGRTPNEITQIAKEQVLKYDSIKFLNGFAVSGRKTNDGFEIITKSGERFTSKKLVIATGIKDAMPAIKGFSECWGISIIHCPYCHGYEHKGVKTAIMANGESAFHLAPLVKNLTNELTILTTGKMEFDEEQLNKIKNQNINIIEKKVLEVKHQNGLLEKVIFEDGSSERYKAIYAAVPFEQHSSIPLDLGCELTEDGYIKTSFFQQTNVEGVFACGDNASPMRSVANAVNTGNITGAIINKELSDKQF